MNTLPLIFEAGHMLVETPEGRWLVDTGSPATFGLGGKVTWGGSVRPIPERMGPISIDQLNCRFGMSVQGLIGTDLLNECNSCWHGPEGEFRLGDDSIPRNAVRVPMGSLLGCPTLEATIAGRPASAIFDTGAQYGYLLDQDRTQGSVPDGTIEDFNPIVGEIQSAAWRVPVTIGSVGFTERCGLLSGIAKATLQLTGIDAILGCSWLRDRTIGYRPSEGALWIGPVRGASA